MNRSIRIVLTMALSFLPGVAAAIEEPAYEVIDQVGDIEIRSYVSHTVAMTRVEAPFAKVGTTAFRRLAGYIFGSNAGQQKIAMTAPVSQGRNEDGSYWVTFMMPSEHSLESLPLPDDAEVRLVERPPQILAAIRYRGGWSQEKYLEHERALNEAISASPRWTAQGEPVWARYNAPFVPAFMRRNEVLLPVTER